MHQATKEAVELTESQLANTATTVWATQKAKAQSARPSATSSRERICTSSSLSRTTQGLGLRPFHAWNPLRETLSRAMVDSG
ncbi:hypothetical protein [Cupriavidus alkaliphilus]|uniref:hypothetical protein n=1 Tax=Cupriavidus alkaliphilus TaxID=942866 RepID=UPI00339D4C59